MPLPTSIDDLSLTADLNFPAGTDSPSQLDNVQRAHASFIAQLRDEVAAGSAGLSASSGASLVGYLPAGTGAVATTVQSKLRERVSVKDFGAVGDGVTDDTAAIQNAFNAADGKVLTLGANETYLYDPTVGLTISNPITIVANGSKFKESQANSGYGFNIQSDGVTADSLVFEFVGTGAAALDEKGITVNGSYIDIGCIHIKAATAGTGAYSSTEIGVKVGPDSGSAKTNIRIGSIKSENWDRPVVFQNLTDFQIGYIDCSTYVRAVYIRDCKNGSIYGGNCRISSPNVKGDPGENGILMESVSASGATNNIRINNFSVSQAGEHSYRLGGQLTISDIWFDNCYSFESGNAATINNPLATEWHGGCGFKILGGTSTLGQPHRNIHFSKCVVEDCNYAIGAFPAGHGFGNFAGFQLAVCEHVNVDNCTLRAKDQTYASGHGIELLAAKNVHVANCSILDCAQYPVRVYEAGVTESPGWDIPSEYLFFSNCDLYAKSSAFAGVPVYVDGALKNHKQFHVQNCSLRGGLYAIRMEVPTAGSYAQMFYDCTYTESTQNPATSTNQVVYGTLSAVLNMRAQWNPLSGTSPQAAAGSIWQDTYGGVFRLRWAGAWRQIITSDILGDNSSSTSLSSATAAINTAGKIQGKQVFNNVNNKMYRAMGSTPTAIWQAVDGSGFITPA